VAGELRGLIDDPQFPANAGIELIGRKGLQRYDARRHFEHPARRAVAG